MLNQVQLIGRLGKTPETQFTQSGMAICKFSLATTHRYKGEDETSWHHVVTFGKLAEICGEYLTSGKLVYIGGRIQYGSYDKDGQTVYTTEIIANEMKMLGGKGDIQPQRPQQDRPSYPDNEDDLPF